MKFEADNDDVCAIGITIVICVFLIIVFKGCAHEDEMRFKRFESTNTNTTKENK
jgi:hypothetical protein